jgi:hypothetical protein
MSSSCGMVQKVAVGTTGDLMFKSTGAIEKEGNWEFFRDGIPGNLKMMEGLVALEPRNEKLLVGLTKGFAGYAFTISETLSLNETLDGKDDGPIREQALNHYSRALEYGLRFLQEQDLSFVKLQEHVAKEGGIVSLLDKHLDYDDMADVEGVLFSAQSLGALILYQRDDMKLVALLPVVKGMFDWVCTHKPKINYGACDVFAGAYEAGRPRALGGNPDKGKEIFLKAIAEYPHNWLMRVTYLRYYVIPMSDEEAFNEQAKFLDSKYEAFKKRKVWNPRNERDQEFSNDSLMLYQSIALKQFEIIKKYKTKLF